MATRRNNPSRIDSSRLLCTLRMYQSILSDFGSSAFRLFDSSPASDSPAAAAGFLSCPSAASAAADSAARRRSALPGAAGSPAFGSSGGGSGSRPPAAGTVRAGIPSPRGCADAAIRHRRLLASGGEFRGRLSVRHVQVVHHANVPSRDPSRAHFREALLQKKSNPARMIAKAKIRINTTIEARNNSVRVGQETLFISASTAIRKSAKPGTLTTRYDSPHAQGQQHARNQEAKPQVQRVPAVGDAVGLQAFDVWNMPFGDLQLVRCRCAPTPCWKARVCCRSSTRPLRCFSDCASMASATFANVSPAWTAIVALPGGPGHRDFRIGFDAAGLGRAGHLRRQGLDDRDPNAPAPC